MGPEFVAGEPALVFGNKVIISDLHIGIEHEFFTSGIKIESQTNNMKHRLEKIIKMTKSKEIIFLGDVKHKVPGISYQEIKEIPEFMNYFSEKNKITIVMGNHDPGIENLGIKNLNIQPTEGFVSDDIYLTHGHTWPNKKFLECRYLVMGHIQPQIEFKDKLGYTWHEPVWVKAKLDSTEVKKKYKKTGDTNVIIMPAFNTLVGGHKLNRKNKGDKEHKTPLMKMLKIKDADIFLLDGTFLGKLKDL